MQADPPASWEDAVCALRKQAGAEDIVKACFYDDPLIDAAQRYWKSLEWRAVRSFLPAQRGRALDVGAGRGISSYALARDGWRVTALEPDPSNVVGAGAIRELAQVADIAIDVAQSWGEDLPFEANMFDVVLCRQVLHHARDLEQLCRQIGRVLKPGGIFMAVREHVISKPDHLRAFLDSHPLHRLYGGEHAYMLKQYTDAIRSSGLRIERVLNPMQSEMNLFPASTDDIKRRWAKRLRLPSPRLVPNAALSLKGACDSTPGRLYSFVSRKPINA